MKLLTSLFLFLPMTFALADTSKVSLNDAELIQFKNNAMDILDKPYCRELFKKYLTFKKPKAFVYATKSKTNTAYCEPASLKTTLEDVEQLLIERCKRKKKKAKKNKFTSPCKILARNDTLLLTRSDLGLKAHTKNIFYAAERNGVDELKKFIDAGIDVNEKNALSLTPLLIAVKENNLETVEYLISQGADLKLKNNKGDDALIIATEENYIDVFEYLLTQGADIATTTNKANRQPIHIAARYGYVGILDVILNKGVDVNQENLLKDTPLHLAVNSRYKPAVNYLIEKGANINAVNKFGKTPLDLAIKLRQKRIIKYLEKKGAKSADSL